MHRVIEAVTLLYVEIALALLIAARALEERLAPPLQKGRSMTTAAAELLALDQAERLERLLERHVREELEARHRDIEAGRRQRVEDLPQRRAVERSGELLEAASLRHDHHHRQLVAT